MQARQAIQSLSDLEIYRQHAEQFAYGQVAHAYQAATEGIVVPIAPDGTMINANNNQKPVRQSVKQITRNQGQMDERTNRRKQATQREKRRMEKLNHCIEDIRSIVCPDMKTPTKAKILREAINRIEYLERVTQKMLEKYNGNVDIALPGFKEELERAKSRPLTERKSIAIPSIPSPQFQNSPNGVYSPGSGSYQNSYSPQNSLPSVESFKATQGSNPAQVETLNRNASPEPSPVAQISFQAMENSQFPYYPIEANPALGFKLEPGAIPFIEPASEHLLHPGIHQSAATAGFHELLKY